MRRQPPLSNVARTMRPGVFAELQVRIDAMVARGADLVPLQIGDTCLPPPEAARRVLAGYDPNDAELHRYGPTAGLAPLREAMAKVLARRGLEYDPAREIFVGNGGTHSLFCAARVLLDEGDEILLASPFWPLAPGVFASAGACPVEVPVTQRLYDDPSLDPAALLAAACTPKTKAIYLTSPNNPDGKVLGAAALARIAELASAHGLWVFSDEVYADTFYSDPPEAPGSIAALPGMRERTIVLQSLSKSHALAGIRVGYFAAPEPVVAAARRVSTHTAFNVAVAMQRAALAALEDLAFPEAARATYRAARDRAVAAMRGLPVRFHLPDGANYLFLDLSPAMHKTGATAQVLLERAVDRGVLLAPGDASGKDYAAFARLCFTAVPIDRVVTGIERLGEALA